MDKNLAKLYVEDALKELGSQSVEWISPNRTLVILDEGLPLDLTVDPESQRIIIKCQLRGGGSQKLSSNTLRRLLEANFMWRGTAGAEMIVENDYVALVQAVDALNTEYAAFRGLLESLLDAADSWSEALSQGILEESEKAAANV